jgi:hypothetical protein
MIVSSDAPRAATTGAQISAEPAAAAADAEMLMARHATPASIERARIVFVSLPARAEHLIDVCLQPGPQ